MLFCSSRLVYFGGYGHKVLADITSRNRNFILDETSWVPYPNQLEPTQNLLTSLRWWFCLQVDDLFWGWNNEVHVFDPVKGSWAEPQTHVSASWTTLHPAVREGFRPEPFCFLQQGRPPAPRAAHAGTTLGRRGYVCGGRVMVREPLIYGWHQIFINTVKNLQLFILSVWIVLNFSCFTPGRIIKMISFCVLMLL